MSCSPCILDFCFSDLGPTNNPPKNTKVWIMILSCYPFAALTLDFFTINLLHFCKLVCVPQHTCLFCVPLPVNLLVIQSNLLCKNRVNSALCVWFVWKSGFQEFPKPFGFSLVQDSQNFPVETKVESVHVV